MESATTLHDLAARILGHEIEYQQWTSHGTRTRTAIVTDWYRFQSFLDHGPEEIPKVGVVNVIDSYGGEGMGDQLWYVFSVVDPPNPTRYFKVSGYYSSYDGGTYEEGEDALSEVAPVQKVVTVYE